MLTSQGYKRRRYPDFIEKMEEQARELFGADVNLTERSPLGKFIKLIAYERADDDELIEEVWNSAFVDTAEGISLEYAVKRALISKKKWLKASGTLQLTLKQNTTIPTGTLFRKKNGVLYRYLGELKANEDGLYTVEIEAIEYGRIGNAEPGEISESVNKIEGLISVTNVEAFRNGQDEESDSELKQRYYESLGKTGNRRTEAIRARVLDEVEGVRACIVDENDTMEVNLNGVPPKAFETIVLGGEPNDVARKIFESKPGGIRAYGKEVVEITDSQGQIHQIGFTYAQKVFVYVKAQIKKGSSYPIDGDHQLKLQILKFIGGANENVQYNGLGMSKDVILARLEARLFNVEGVEDVKVTLSLDGVNYVEENIPIGFAQVAETDFSKIEVSEFVG